MIHEDFSFRVFRWCLAGGLILFSLIPIYVMVTTSVKPLIDVQRAFEWWPSTPTLDAFVDMWSTVPLAQYFLNSLVVCTLSTLLSVLVAVLAAYAISRYRFHGRNSFLRLILATQMFPGVLFLLPLFLIFVNIDNLLGADVLYQTRLGLIVMYLTFNLPFAIWMLNGYFDGIPRELDEAGRVDGLSAVGVLFRILLPVARPGVIAVAVYAFMTSWGEILFASVMTNPDTATLSIGLQSYSSEANVYWNQIMAATLTASLPIMLLFLILQRHLIAGLASGSVK